MNIRRRFLSLTLPMISAAVLLLAVYFAAGLSLSAKVDTALAAEGDVIIGPKETTLYGDPGATLTYTNWITNDRPTEETITLDIANTEIWDVQISTNTLTIGGRLSDTVVITVSVPQTALAGPVTTYVTATTSASGHDTDTAANITYVNAIPGVELSAQDDTLSGSAGANVIYSMDVSNTGNATDTYSIAAASGPLGFLATSQPTVTVAAGQIGNFTVTVAIAGDADGGDDDSTTVTTTSSINQATYSTETLTTSVIEAAGVTIVPENQNRNIAPGNTATFTHTVTNTGNRSDTFSIEAAADPPGYVVEVDPAEIALGRDAFGTIEISVTVPAGTLSDTVITTLVTATSTLVDPNVYDTATDIVTVAQAPAVTIESSESSNGDPGAAVEYVHTVTNNGNGEETFDLTAQSTPAYTTLVVPESLILDTNESGSVTVTLNIPGNAVAGVVIDTSVSATSRSDTNVSASLEDHTTVNLKPAVTIESNESRNADPGSTVEYTHTVTNDSNGRETFDVTAVSAPAVGTQVIPESLTLNRNRSGQVRVIVSVPVSAAEGDVINTTVTATSRSDSDVKDSVLDRTTANAHRLFLPMVVTPPVWNQVGKSSWNAADSAASVDICSTDSDLILAGTQDALRIFNGAQWQTETGSAPGGDTVSSVKLDESCTTAYAVVFKDMQDAVIDAHGVWQGTLTNQGNWVWRELVGGVNVTMARDVELSGGRLFAGGGFGIAYWDGDEWIATNIQQIAGTIDESFPIMDLSTADGVNNTGPIYAVHWWDPQIYRVADPANLPGQWAVIPGLPDVPDRGLISVAGDANNVRSVGTWQELYSFVGGAWQLVNSQRTYAVLVSEAQYAGYTAAKDENGNFIEDGDGVFMSYDLGITFVAYNQGWSPPPEIRELASNAHTLVAATSEGVFRR